MGILAGLLRIALIFLAVRFVWTAITRSLGLGRQRQSMRSRRPDTSGQSVDGISDAEDIEFEDIE